MNKGSEPAQAPIAARREHHLTHHGMTVDDHCVWLRDPGYPKIESPEILAHLRAENDWFESQMAPVST